MCRIRKQVENSDNTTQRPAITTNDTGSFQGHLMNTMYLQLISVMCCLIAEHGFLIYLCFVY